MPKTPQDERCGVSACGSTDVLRAQLESARGGSGYAREVALWQAVTPIGPPPGFEAAGDLPGEDVCCGR